jgi:uncharacterized RDD family membrane protein YckC
MKYSGFWRRFAAAFIDGLIIGVVPSLVIGHDNAVTTNGLSFLVGLSYSVWMNGTYGATVGKMVMKIKIVKESGSKINYQDAALRYFASILSAVVLLIGYIVMIWDSKKQTWHDRIAKTVVTQA